MTQMSSREANQHFGKAKRAAEKGPVVITDRGRPAYVLIKYEEYRRQAGKRRSIVDLLSQDGPEADFDFDPPRLSDHMGFRIPDFDD